MFDAFNAVFDSLSSLSFASLPWNLNWFSPSHFPSPSSYLFQIFHHTKQIKFEKVLRGEGEREIAHNSEDDQTDEKQAEVGGGRADVPKEREKNEKG